MKDAGSTDLGKLEVCCLQQLHGQLYVRLNVRPMNYVSLESFSAFFQFGGHLRRRQVWVTTESGPVQLLVVAFPLGEMKVTGVTRQMDQEGVKQAEAPKTDRRTISGFLQNAIVLTGLYFFIGGVYHQAYLRELGVRVGFVNLNELVPRYTDPLILIYTFALWLLVNRLPDRWFARFAEFVSPENFRHATDFGLRLGALVIIFILIVIGNNIYILLEELKPAHPWEQIIPSTTFLARPLTALGFAFLVAGLVLLYYHYTRIRRRQLAEATSKNRQFMKIVLVIVVPIFIVYGTFAVSFVFPSFYGALRANIDVTRMRDRELARVHQLQFEGATCLPTASGVNGHFVYEEDITEELHYLGEFADRLIFLEFSLDQLDDPEESYSICAVVPERVTSIKYVDSD